MIIYPSDFNSASFDKTKLAVASVCRQLNLKCNLNLSTMWSVATNDSKELFIELVNEELERTK